MDGSHDQGLRWLRGDGLYQSDDGGTKAGSPTNDGDRKRRSSIFAGRGKVVSTRSSLAASTRQQRRRAGRHRSSREPMSGTSKTCNLPSADRDEGRTAERKRGRTPGLAYTKQVMNQGVPMARTFVLVALGFCVTAGCGDGTVLANEMSEAPKPAGRSRAVRVAAALSQSGGSGKKAMASAHERVQAKFGLGESHRGYLSVGPLQPIADPAQEHAAGA